MHYKINYRKFLHYFETLRTPEFNYEGFVEKKQKHLKNDINLKFKE